MLALTLLFLPASGAPLKLVVPGFEYKKSPQARYINQLLELALRKTAADGPFVVTTYPEIMSADRGVRELKNKGVINLLWNTPSRERVRDLLPIRISLLRDLNSYRVLMIRREDQPRFDKVRTLDDLRKLRAGVGAQWQDRLILQANDMPSVSGMLHANLFRMLQVNRFDYFPRGLYEAWGEAALPENRGLAIESGIMLYFDLPFYFFVNKADTALAARIERGLKLALADGSFDQLMLSVPDFKRGLEEQRNNKRRLFTLHAAP